MSLELKKDVTIIVSVIVVENDTILLMQEAKPECFGLWYLPAGRLEKYENLVEGVKREGREETGLEIEPIALLCVEMKSLKWVRFNFIGKSIGGTLKKIADKESLRADWVPITVALNGGNQQWPLRAQDIVKLIDRFVNRDINNNAGILPRVVAHTNIQFRFYMRWANDILVDKSTKQPPIVTARSSHHSLESILMEFIKINFLKSSISIGAPFDILGLEFAGSNKGKSEPITDGFLLELIIGVQEKHELSGMATVEWNEFAPINNLLTINTNQFSTLILLR